MLAGAAVEAAAAEMKVVTADVVVAAEDAAVWRTMPATALALVVAAEMGKGAERLCSNFLRGQNPRPRNSLSSIQLVHLSSSHCQSTGRILITILAKAITDSLLSLLAHAIEMSE